MEQNVKNYAKNMQEVYEIKFEPVKNRELADTLYQFESLKKMSYYLQKEKERLELCINQYRDEISKIEFRQTTIDNQKRLLRSLEDKIRDANERLNKLLQEEIPQQEERLRFAKEEFKRVKIRTVEYYKNIDKAKKETENINFEKEQTENKWENQKSKFITEMKNMKQKLEEFKTIHQKEFNRMKEFHQQKRKLSKELENLKREVSELNTVKDNLIKQIEESSSQETELKREIEDKIHQKKLLKEKLIEMTQEINRLTARKNSDIKQGEKLREEIAELLSSKDTTLKELNEIRLGRDRLKEEVERYKKEISEMEKKLEAELKQLRATADKIKEKKEEITYIISYKGKNYLLKQEELREYLKISRVDRDEWVWNEQEQVWEPIEKFRNRLQKLHETLLC
ncbi:MAG: hypothetical protein AB1765_04960 [Candidatus Hydrogenedentota bacterium]